MSDWASALAPAAIGGFEHPWRLALALPVLAAWLWIAARRRPRALVWPAVAEALVAGARRRDPLGPLSLALRGLAALALCAVLAGPLGRDLPLHLQHEGLDVVLVLDTSGSMRTLDAEVDGEYHTRLELAREVVARFAEQRVAEGDRVGLVVFGDSAFTQSPLSSDGALLAIALRRVEAGMAGESTALGDALALAVKRAAPEAGEAAPAARPLAGRVVVLLTDGRANSGAVPTDVAAALAAARRVRVHTVGIGGSGEAPVARDGGGRSLGLERHDLDAATLQRIASATGGRFLRAESSADLAAVYAEIDQLERVPRDAPQQIAGAPLPEPLLALALGALALDGLVSRGLARRLP